MSLSGSFLMVAPIRSPFSDARFDAETTLKRPTLWPSHLELCDICFRAT